VRLFGRVDAPSKTEQRRTSFSAWSALISWRSRSASSTPIPRASGGFAASSEAGDDAEEGAASGRDAAGSSSLGAATLVVRA
jgi:hypothetical protein